MAQDIIHRFDTLDEVAQAVAERFVEYTNECIARTETCIVGLSGGTTPNALFELLNSDAYVNRIDWENIYFLWVDERFVPHSNPDSNYYRAKTRLFSNIQGCYHVYPVPTSKGTVEEVARLYEKEVDTVLKACEKTGLDLVLLGLGDDGHVASLFAGSVALKATTRIAAVEDGKVWERVTMTFPFLATVAAVWYTVVGESKRAALAKVLKQRIDYESDTWEERLGHVLPGAVIAQPTVEWYVDAAAMKE